MKILFVSTLFSPFQIELARAVNALTPRHYWTLFSQPVRHGRKQGHWVNFDYADIASQVLTPSSDADLIPWVEREIERLCPDVIILGGAVGATQRAAKRVAERMGIRFGYWMEGLRPRSVPGLRQSLQQVARFRLRGASFILAIGDRAEREYRAFGTPVHFVPYGQDLSRCFDAPRAGPARGPVRLLFSGQLLARHNLPMVVEALHRVQSMTDAPFAWTIAGDGPERSLIERRLQMYPELSQCVRIENNFADWDDRLRPYAEHDLLVYPSDHSGWGLVVPEAMAAGMPVLTTRSVEAARFFVRHRVNGVFVEPVVDEIARELCDLVSHPEKVYSMGLRARDAARDGDAGAVAERMLHALQA